MSLDHLTGRSYGPFPAVIDAGRVAEFVAATGDDPARWSAAAPPGFAAALLFAAAPGFFADDSVRPLTTSLLHSEQRFAWDRPLRLGAEVEVTGTVESVRTRRSLNLVSFAVSAAGEGGTVLRSDSTFVMSDEPAAATPAPEEAEPQVYARGDNASPAAASLPSVGAALASLPKSASRFDLVRYASASGDFNPIHWDHDFATSAGLPGVIVHGLLMMSWLIQGATRHAGGDAPLVMAKARFRRPLRPAEPAVVVGTVGEPVDEDAILKLSVTAAAGDLVTGEARLRGAA